MAKQVFDLHAGKGISRGQSTEHLRDYSNIDPDAKKYGYYDPTRMNLNFEVTTGGRVVPVNKSYSIDRRMKDNLRRRGIKDPNEEKIKKGLPPNRNTVANIILGGSRNRMLELAFGDQKVDLKKGADNSHLQRKEDIEKWAVDMYNWVSRKYGEENVLAFVVHLDEKNPHVHCTVLPVNKINNRVSYRSIFGDRVTCHDIMRNLHDEVAAINEKWNLDRGDDIKHTGAKHVASEEYWRNLRDECTRLENEKGSVKEAIELLYAAQRKAEIANKSLTTMVTRKQQQIDNLNKDIEELENRQMETDYNNDMLKEEQERLQNLLHQFQKELEDKQEKLRINQQRLSEVNEKLKELQQRQFELIKENDEIQKKYEDIFDKYQDKLQDEMRMHGFAYFQTISEEFTKRLSNFRNMLSPVMQQELNKVMNITFFEEIANYSNQIVAAATALFLGYLDQATQITVSAGGGGNPGTSVGRRKDEDDDDYKYRCFVMACMMMRPGQQKQSRGFRR